MAFPVVAMTGLGALLTYAVASGVAQGIARGAIGLGVGYLAFTGADTLVTQNSAQVLSLLNAMPPLAVSLFGVLKVGTCVKIMFSAMLMRLSIFGLNAGIIKRMAVTGTPT